ncbi:MAG: hypothetical protein LBQ14_00340 [Treponema sp.]|jgi:hypothetical protein|nr:hypothetical protein [Treponema sp.]
MTLYRGQKSKHNNCIFGPELLRGNTVECIKKYIKSRTGITDMDLNLYKSELVDCYFPKLPFPALHKKLAIDDHLYYFFLSLVNAWLKAQENRTLIDPKYSSFFQQFITANNKKIERYTLSPPQDVRNFIEILLKTDAMFDGDRLNVYSFFQHLNFVSPKSYPTLLLDWTSNINVASLFSIDESGKIGTVVSMEYPNELYPRFDAYSGTTFFNAYGYACVQEDNNAAISDAAGSIFRKIPPYSLFDNLLMKVQEATCLYWPYKCTLEDLNTKYKEALDFRILSEDEVFRLMSA